MLTDRTDWENQPICLRIRQYRAARVSICDVRVIVCDGIENRVCVQVLLGPYAIWSGLDNS